MTVGPGRQRRHDRATIRRQPTLTPEADGDRTHNQVLDQICLVPFEPRSRRHFRRYYPILDHLPTQFLAAAATPFDPARPRLRRACLFHARRLDRWRALQALQTRNLDTLLGNQLLQRRNLVQQLQDQRPQIAGRQIIKISGR
jgi:hypothetical protein